MIERRHRSAALDGRVPRFPAEQCDRLFAAVLVHDRIDLEAELPDVVHFDYCPEHFAAGFALARQLWNSGVCRRRLTRLATKLASGGQADAAAIAEFKDIRARFKQLRFAYAMFDERHVYAPSLHRFTKTMGHLQDSLRNGHGRRAAVRAVVLRLLLMRPLYRRMRRGLDRFDPSSATDFRAFMTREMAEVRAFVVKPQVTGKEFHEVRKIVSRLVAFYDCMKTLYPSAYHDQVGCFVGTINGMMGAMHDDLIERRLSREQDYHAGTFPLPAEIAQRLRTLERRFSLPCRQAA